MRADEGIANPVFNDMLSIIQKKSIENHYNIMVQQIDQDEDELDAAIAQMKEKTFTGNYSPGRNHKKSG